MHHVKPASRAHTRASRVSTPRHSFARKLTKTPKKPFLCKSAVLSQTRKPQSLAVLDAGSPALPKHPKTLRFGAVQQFRKEASKSVVLSQKNQSFFAKVMYCPKNQRNQWTSGPSQDLKRCISLQRYSSFTKNYCFLGQCSVFARRLTNTMYCQQKHCCSVPPKTKEANVPRGPRT